MLKGVIGGGGAIGDDVTSGTAGSILFVGAGGVLAQDNANLFYDDTNNRLGIGTNSPATTLAVTGTATFNEYYTDAANYSRLKLYQYNFNTLSLFADSANTYRNLRLESSYGSNITLGGDVTVTTNHMEVTSGLSVGTATAPINTLDVNGGVAIGSYATVNSAPSNGLIVSGQIGIGAVPTQPSKLVIQPTALTGQNGIELTDNVSTNLLFDLRSGGSLIGPSTATYLGLGTSNTERIRIDANGNVGIGTNSPRRKIDILDASNPQLRLTYTDNSVYTDFQTNSSGNLYISPSGTVMQVNVNDLYINRSGTGVNGGYSFLTAGGNNWFQGLQSGTTDWRIYNFSLGANAMYMKYSNSFIGLGTDNPLTKLHIVSGNANAVTFTYDSSNNYRSYIYSEFNAGVPDGGFLTLKISDGSTTGTVDAFKITGAGNATILNNLTIGGTFSGKFTAPLTVPSGNGQAIKLTYDTAGNYITSLDTVFVGGTASANSLTFKVSDGTTTGQTTVMTMLGNGNVGIGVASPTAYLHLNAGTATANTAPLKFNSGTNLTTPEAGAVEYDGSRLYSTKATAIREALVGTIFTQTADKSVTNTVTETSIVGTGVGTLTLPANFLVAGKTIRVTMSGVYSTVVVTGDTVTIKVKYGSTVLASKATTALVTGGTNLAWEAELLVTCRTTGATGTVQTAGGVTYQVAGAAAIYDEINNGITTATLDTTASGLFDVSVTHSAANASNTVKSLVSTFEILN